MKTRGRALALGIGAFVLGGLVVGGIAAATGGFVPAAGFDGPRGFAGPFIFFGFFKLLFTLFIFMMLFRLMAFGFGWNRRGHFAHHGMEPRSRLESWHEQAHSDKTAGADESSGSDQNDGDDDSSRS